MPKQCPSQSSCVRSGSLVWTLAYCWAAQSLGTAPAETLVFEDSLYALKTAAAAGFPTVGVFDANGEADQAGLRDAATVYLAGLADFPSHWSGLNN